jgi:hypothetical protein
MPYHATIRYDIGANSNRALPRTGPRSIDNSTAADRARALGGDTGGFNITRYGYRGDPYTDSGTRLLLGNANNILNADSIALSPDVANRLGVHVGDPVIINGHFLGYYQDSTAANLRNRVDIYDPNGRGH